jgi:hypothetical protein
MTMDLALVKGETPPCLRDVTTGMLEQMFFNMSMLSPSLSYPPIMYVPVPGRLWCVANQHNQKRVSLLGSLPLFRNLTAQLSITQQQMHELYHILFKIGLKSFTLKHSHSSYMFRHIVCHPQGALMVLAKITCKSMNIT